MLKVFQLRPQKSGVGANMFQDPLPEDGVSPCRVEGPCLRQNKAKMRQTSASQMTLFFASYNGLMLKTCLKPINERLMGVAFCGKICLDVA